MPSESLRTEDDKALVLVLRAAQWLLDDVANDLRRSAFDTARCGELRAALTQVVGVLDQRCAR